MEFGINNIEYYKVSVVLCTYNGSKFLSEQLESLISQSYKISEIVIVDDCSSDKTIKIIQEYQEKYQNIFLYKNQANIGPIASFLKGIRLTEDSDYFAFCDQDDIWSVDKLERQVQCIISARIDNNLPLLVFHDLKVVDTNLNIISNSFWKMRGIAITKVNFENILFSNVVTGCTCLINNSMKKELAILDESNIMMHDHWIGLIGYSFGQVLFLEEQLMDYRSHNNSVTQKERQNILISK